MIQENSLDKNRSIQKTASEQTIKGYNFLKFRIYFKIYKLYRTDISS
jgi:hypothetical protein